jgi:hypothetical protein
VLYRFTGSASFTTVRVTFEIPARGVKRLIAPLLRLVAQWPCAEPSRKTAGI